MKHLNQYDHLLPGEQEIPLSWLEEYRLPVIDEEEIEELCSDELNFDR